MSWKWRAGGRAARTSTATRLAASVVAISLVSLVVATIVGVTTGEELADEVNEQRLRATVESAALDVASEIIGLERTTFSLAASRQAAVATERFSEAIDELDRSLDEDRFDEEQDELIGFYRETYIEPVAGSGSDVQLRDVTPTSTSALYLQYAYGFDIGDVARAQTIDDADDGSDWTEVHRAVHPTYRNIVNSLDLLDLYLVDRNGVVVYTVNKRADLGSDLQTGPFSGSVVANAFRRAVRNPELRAVSSDLQFYDPIPGRPVGVVGSRIMDGADLAGVLLVSYDASNLTDLVTADEEWEEAGLPETGDVVVFGSDGVLRTDPRAYLQTPGEYLATAVDTDRLDDEQVARVERIGTTVLTDSVADDTRDAGIDRDDSVRRTSNISGADVLSISAPVDLESPTWFVTAEVENQAARGAIDDFQELLIVGAAIFVVVLAFLAVAWANGIIRPVRLISDRIGRRERSDEPITVPPQTPVEIQQLAARLDTMKNTLSSQQDQIAAAREERLDLLRSMLPPSVASRIASGDVRSLEQAPAATVVVIVVGLSDFMDVRSETAERELVDQLVGQFDELAYDHGLDRIKVVGDAYYAVCGHDRPYIDHAPRSVGFAEDALAAAAGLDVDPPITLAIGINSGAVATGTAGGASLVYDVWGPTVSVAHHLARRARHDEILVSSASLGLLPDSIVTEPSADGAASRVVPGAAEEVPT